MTEKEKAEHIVNSILPNMYCYLGSGMLTNDYNKEVATERALNTAKIIFGEFSAAGMLDDYWIGVYKHLSEMENNIPNQ